MILYDKDGSFGKVRFGYIPVKTVYDGVLDQVLLSGWHRVNDQYVIIRENGDPGTRPDYYVILFTVGGQGELVMGEEHKFLLPGSCAFVPAWKQSAYFTSAGREWEFYWIHVTGTNAKTILSDLERFGKHSFEGSDYHEYLRIVSGIVDSERTGQDYEIYTAGLIMQLLLLAERDLRAEKLPAAAGGRVVMKVKQYLEEHYGEKLNIGDLARSSFISEEHLIRLFRKETGMTPHRYLMELRISQARKLLRLSPFTVGHIAQVCGFSSIRAFCTQYKAFTGQTPTEARSSKKLI